MAVRKAAAYSRHYTRPSTRKSAVKRRNYIKTVPAQKITKFHMGDIKKYNSNRFNIILTMQSKESIQIRDLALEAVIQYVHKELETTLPGQYYFAVKVYPHHIQRNHKVLTGAGADRMAIGMAHSWGTSEGRAALLKEGSAIFVVAVNDEKAAAFTRATLHKIKAKIPCSSRIVTEIHKEIKEVKE